MSREAELRDRAMQALADYEREQAMKTPRATAPCPRCERHSEGALRHLSCCWCGHAWSTEGAAQPPAGGPR